jgi:hypothetical protein
MQKGKALEDSGSNTRQSRLSAGPKWAQADRPSPFPSPVDSLSPSCHSDYL